MRYYIGVIVVVLLMIFGSIFLLSRGKNAPQKAKPVTPSQVDLVKDTSHDITVSVTTDGRVVAKENHYAIRVTVSATQRSLEVTNGYDGSVTNLATLPNDQAAFEVLTRALQIAGFTKTRKGTTQTDERGVCPTGNRYIYEVQGGGEQLLRSWSTSCGSQGSFTGNGPLIRDLMQKQIPNYGSLTTNLQL